MVFYGVDSVKHYQKALGRKEGHFFNKSFFPKENVDPTNKTAFRSLKINLDQKFEIYAQKYHNYVTLTFFENEVILEKQMNVYSFGQKLAF